MLEVKQKIPFDALMLEVELRHQIDVLEGAEGHNLHCQYQNHLNYQIPRDQLAQEPSFRFRSRYYNH